MATASFQQYKEMGESLGLSGEKLAEYVTKQQSADRAERQAEREARDTGCGWLSCLLPILVFKCYLVVAKLSS